MDQNEFELFRKEMNDVVPLKTSGKKDIKTAAPLTPGQIYRRKAAENRLPDDNFLPTGYIDLLHPYDILSFKRDGVQYGVFRKLRLGYYPIEAILDLHRFNPEKARHGVYRFIQDCPKYDVRTALIRHGKGTDKDHPAALLKSLVARWLLLFPQVLAFHSAQQHHGGVGAVYVLVRKSEKQKEINRRRFGLAK